MSTTATDAGLSAEIPGADRYLPFYRLAFPPFRSTADPERLWLGNAHRTILDTLARAIRDDTGIAILTGDAGTGKTSLSQRLIATLGPAGVSVGRVSSPGDLPSDFFEAVLSAYGVRRAVPSKDVFATCIRDILSGATAQGSKTLLVVDEAQGLGHDLLCEVGNLSAVAAAAGQPLVILLVGETRLTAALLDDRHAPLRERIIARCGVPPLGPDEVSAYVRHYLEAAGAVTEIFSPEAILSIASLSRGAPGAINIIADRALLVGRARQARPITEAIVGECGRSPGSTSTGPAGVVRPSPRWTSLRPRGKARGRFYVTLAATALLVTGSPYLVWWLTGLGNHSARTASDDSSRPSQATAREESPAPGAAALPPAVEPASPVSPGDPDRVTLPDRRAPVSAAPVEAHAAIPGRPGAAMPRVTAPPEGPTVRDNPVLREGPAVRESPPTRERPVAREIAPPVTTRRTPAPAAAAPARIATPEAASQPRAPEGRAYVPDPSAVIDWLMKSSPGRR